MEPKTSKKRPQILETTLRDGSYVLGFQFTARDTEVIAGGLDQLGFDMIEVGHGVGMGASAKGYGKAAETDETYLKVTANTVKRAKWGMFCIPGIASLDDVDMAASYGMSFLRVGTDVTKVEAAEPFIERAKKHGMYVSSNLMKSYAVEPAYFASRAKVIKEYGADILAVVDSAGGMLPEDMTRYFEAVREVCDIPLAFHGHNNLELAVSNSLRAWELGAEIIDTSLQGMGRGAGNTPTEIFLAVLERKGVDTGIDIFDVMDLGETTIKPMLQRVGYDSVDVISGFAQFHSSYMKTIREYSQKYNVDPRRLIVEVCKENRETAPPALVEACAQRMQDAPAVITTARFRLDKYVGSEQE